MAYRREWNNKIYRADPTLLEKKAGRQLGNFIYLLNFFYQKKTQKNTKQNIISIL